MSKPEGPAPAPAEPTELDRLVSRVAAAAIVDVIDHLVAEHEAGTRPARHDETAAA